VGGKRAERQIVVAGAPGECFDALTDFESYPEWQSAVNGCEVVDRDEKGRGRRVRFEIDAKVKSVAYTLDYSYEEPHLLSWRFVEGDVKDVEGEFVLEDQGDGTTLATYSLRIDTGVWLPGAVTRMLNDQVMQRSVEDLKMRVENAA
jgi:ribosome-associated toxin RatA of RatAB toxin-antitoxin module